MKMICDKKLSFTFIFCNHNAVHHRCTSVGNRKRYECDRYRNIEGQRRNKGLGIPTSNYYRDEAVTEVFRT